jgi:predicted protein tyrosine phosphatase
VKPACAITVCSYKWMVENIDDYRPEYLVTVMDDGETIETPSAIPQSNHLKFNLLDTFEEDPTIVRNVLQSVLDFGRNWNGRDRVLVHCGLGISRSPAIALILACQKNPGRESEVARSLRLLAPFVSPNPDLIEIADELLDLRGGLVRARKAMGGPQLDDTVFPIEM